MWLYDPTANSMVLLDECETLDCEGHSACRCRNGWFALHYPTGVTSTIENHPELVRKINEVEASRQLLSACACDGGWSDRGRGRMAAVKEFGVRAVAIAEGKALAMGYERDHVMQSWGKRGKIEEVIL